MGLPLHTTMPSCKLWSYDQPESLVVISPRLAFHTQLYDKDQWQLIFRHTYCNTHLPTDYAKQVTADSASTIVSSA